jgi:hypothetical protein
MLEKVSRVAEEAASIVSRRQFLGQLGIGAMRVAAAIGGVLALSNVVQGRPPVRICGDRSSFSCVSAPVGAECFDGDGFGRCRKLRGSSDCYCDTGR